MRISWLELPELIEHELRQRDEEGSDVSSFREEWNRIKSLSESGSDVRKLSNELYTKIETAKSEIINVYNEPSDWAGIVSLAGIKNRTSFAGVDSVVEDKILGGWLGRSSGCMLGKPVEKISRAGIRELLSSNNTWPITNYVSGKGIPDHLLKKYPWNRHYGKESLLENIVCMPEDDDMNYPMLNLTAVERYGRDITSEQIIQTWLDLAPVLSTFTAERIAYRNRLNGILPPESGSIGNPYREWIGAQIRADLWGWIAPSQPAFAAELACRDASVSHVRNGMYGEMFFAAAVSSAFHHSDIRTVITEALTVIPPNSHFAEAIRFVLTLPIHNQAWETTVDSLYERFGHYHWVHTINNAALATAALLSSNGDFETAVCNVVMGGWDTDSNGATVGSVIGTMNGAKALPEKWIAPLHDTIRSSVKGFDNSSLSELAQRTINIAKTNISL
ncbi:MAG: ADP-ribosylglycohydrolase family protein [Bacteroidota bacterium]